MKAATAKRCKSTTHRRHAQASRQASEGSDDHHIAAVTLAMILKQTTGALSPPLQGPRAPACWLTTSHERPTTNEASTQTTARSWRAQRVEDGMGGDCGRAGSGAGGETNGGASHLSKG